MVQRPLANDPGGLVGQLAVDDLTRVDRDERLEALVAGMEVRGRMIVELHPDHDAKKERNHGHRSYVHD